MALCSVCQELDVRELLNLSLKAREDYEGSDGFFHTRLSKSAKHHNNIFCLRAAAEEGCQLCSIIWDALVDTCKRVGTELSDEKLRHLYDGEIFFGTDGWWESPGSKPNVLVTAHRLDGENISDRRQICALDVFAKRDCMPNDDPSIVSLLSRDTLEDSSSPACLSVGAEWLKSCLETHPDCSLESGPLYTLPTRVIDVGSSSKNPFLHISDPEALGSWVALSYCWGGPSDFTLTRSRSAELQNGLPLSNFPQTIQDAILITRALGQQYLWVDALCIFQAPQDKTEDIQYSRDDWTREAPKMAEIYRNAIVTIAATASPTVKTGILGVRKPKLPPSCCLSWRTPQTQREQEYASVYLSCEKKVWDDVLDIQRSTWDSRGWTMQERFLASRTLAFTPQQIVWECSSLWTVESECSPSAIGGANLFRRLNRIAKEYPYPTHPGLPSAEPSTQPIMTTQRRGLVNKQPYDLWYEIVTVYSQRQLAYCEDKLPAISGLAKRVELALQDQYCAGLWRNDLLKGLLWESYRGQVEPVSLYLGPSWSWVGILSALITWELNAASYKEDYEELATIESVNIANDPPQNLYGRISHAELVITAPFYRVDNLKDEGHNLKSEYKHIKTYVSLFLGENSKSAGFIEFCQQHKPYSGQNFALLQILCYHHTESIGYYGLKSLQPAIAFLLIESVSGKDNTYRRIGHFSLRDVREGHIYREALRGIFSIRPVEGKAWYEVREREWPLKTVTMI